MTTKFDLNNFKSKEPLSDASPEKLPKWHKNLSKNGKRIYTEVLTRKKIIIQEIKAGEKLNIGERLIVPSQIATSLNLHRSTIQKRRHPELVKFIEEQNLQLEKLWETEGKKNNYSQKTKVQLSKEVANLKRLLKAEKDKNISEVITLLLNNEQNQKQARLVAKLSELEEENALLTKTIAKLRVRSRKI